MVQEPTIQIQQKTIGAGSPCFVIAEIGVNHNGCFDTAIKMIEEAAASQVDAVKFQTFKASELVTATADKADYQTQATKTTESQQEMLTKLEFSAEQFAKLKEHSEKCGLIFLSTPFDYSSVDILDDLGIAAYKVPSGEVPNTPFLSYIAKKEKPIILSTGMSTLAEVEEAFRSVTSVGNNDLVILHCVSCYPTDPSDANLRAMQTIKTAFNTIVGFSDHTLGLEISFAAVALGASVLEKHFTLSREMEGPDHAASLEPGELRELIKGIRNIEAALGDGVKVPVEAEKNTADVARKSIVAMCDITEGTVITDSLLSIKRPGTGLSPKMLEQVIGRTANCDIQKDALVNFKMLR